MPHPKFDWYKLGGSAEKCVACGGDAWYFIQERFGDREYVYVCDIHATYWLKLNKLR